MQVTGTSHTGKTNEQDILRDTRVIRAIAQQTHWVKMWGHEIKKHGQVGKGKLGIQ